jgi:hypothetical protein
MKKKRNHLPGGFLNKYRTGEKGSIQYIHLNQGYLKLEYDEEHNPGILLLVSYIRSKSNRAAAIGCRLEMALADNEAEEDVVTYITENGVSGLQWAHGGVYWGHVYDDETGPVSVRMIGLDEWVDECIENMINPS